MNVEQVRKYYEGKANVSCPITERLIKAGYQQLSGGYINYAHEMGVNVDYRNAEPTQWWHLIKSYCDRTEPTINFTKQIVCGELIFWMAEVADCCEKSELSKLADEIIASGVKINRKSELIPKVIYDRKKWNKKIQEICFDKIVETVEAYSIKE